MLAKLAIVALAFLLAVPAAAQTPGALPSLAEVELDRTAVAAGQPIRVTGRLLTQVQPPARLWVDATLPGDLGSFNYPVDPQLDLVEGWVARERPGDPLTMQIKVAPAIGADSGPKPYMRFRWSFHLNDLWYFVRFRYLSDGTGTGFSWQGNWYYCRLALGSNCFHGDTPPFPVTWDAATRTFTGRIRLADLAAKQESGRLVQDTMRPFSSQYPPESGYELPVITIGQDSSAPFAPYDLPIETVFLGIAPVGSAPQSVNYSVAADVQTTAGSLDVPFSGQISTEGLATGAYDLWVKGCFGPCVTRTFRISVS
ncbi:MAG TPA: hypothetical protein VM638_03870 [Actinomycetota bacterium]|nr:hypothetical protein [Actinomycetota bacterium]